MNIVVLGSAAGVLPPRCCYPTTAMPLRLWSHDPKKAELLNETRENPLLKGVRIPERITVTSDLSSLASAEMVVFASAVVRAALRCARGRTASERRGAARFPHEGHRTRHAPSP